MERVKQLLGSLSFRLPLLVIAVALPAVALTVWTHLEHRQNGANAARAQGLQVARSIATDYADAVQAATQLLSPLASIFGLIQSPEGFPNETCVAFFARFVGAGTDFPFVGVAAPDGQLVCTSEGDPADNNIAHFGFFQRALNSNAVVVSRFRQNQFTNSDVISVARAVRNVQMEVTGVVYVDIAADSLSPGRAAEQLPAGSFVNVTDREGTIIARYPHEAEVIGTSIAGEPMFQRFHAEQEGTLELTSFEGVDSLVSFTPIDLGDGDDRAYVAVGLPAAEAYSAANSLLLRNLLILAGVSLGALVAGRVVAQPWIFGPINRLSNSAVRIASGELETRVGPNYPPGELGQLARAFDTMAGQVQSREQDVRILNETLEARVEQRTKQLEEANKELEAFSYSVSHDLRAPIRAINGFSRIVVDEHGSKLPPDAQRFLRLILQSSVTMTHLIDDLLHFSRIGRASMERRHVPMSGVIQDALAEVRGEIGDRSIDFRIEELGPELIDPALMQRVYTNLLSNSIKFTRNVADPRVEVGKRIEGDETVYFVRDNGAGFDTKYADKLFGVFQRLHRADEFEGTGVGLATAHRVISRHGGRIWAEAAPNQGATFFFTIGPEEAEEGEENGR